MASRYNYLTSLQTVVLIISLLGMTGCRDDDFKNRYPDGNVIGINIEVQDSWKGGVAQDDGRAPSRAAIVTSLDAEVGQPLYLHTTVERDTVLVSRDKLDTRGTMIKNEDDFHPYFSLSAICYTGNSYPEEEDNNYTPNFAYHLKYNKSGKAEGSDLLPDWPGHGSKIKFFAFAPYEYKLDGSEKNYITLSPSEATGSPCITYETPTDAREHTDLMVAVTDATEPAVNLQFKHMLTAIRVKASADMLKCKIKKVTLSGIYTKGKFNMGSQQWSFDGDPNGSCSATFESAAISEDDSGSETEDQSAIVDGVYTFLVIPQTLTTNATLTIVYTDELTGAERSISGKIGSDDNSKKWRAADMVKYEVSDKSFSIAGYFDLYYNGQKIEAGSEISVPYTGVLYDVTLKPGIQISEANSRDIRTVSVAELSDITEECSTDDGETWRLIGGEKYPFERVSADDPKKGFEGALVFNDVSPSYELKLHSGFQTTSKGTRAAPVPVENERGKNETANCYMIDTPGYYSFPVVYGNSKKGGVNNTAAYTVSRSTDQNYPQGITEFDRVVKKVNNGVENEETEHITVQPMNYFVNHANDRIGEPEILGVADAILVWQDSPDLVRDVHYDEDKGRVVFQVDERTIAQGNAMIAVRGAKTEADKEPTILWSWHIWVTTTANLTAWETGNRVVATDSENQSYTYYLTPTNLGYCEKRGKQDEKTVKIRLKCKTKLATQPGGERIVECGERIYSMKMEGIEASMAGDNPYYQWGRKDPIPPGVYSNRTDSKYSGNGLGNSSNMNNMDRKKLFNVHPAYTRTRTPYEDENIRDKQGVSIGYTIQHPNEHIMGKDNEKTLIETYNGNIDYRKHWHRSRGEGYLDKDAGTTHHVLYHLWNASASGLGKTHSNDKSNFQKMTKTIYDPCPAGFCVPNAGVFLALADASNGSNDYSGKDAANNSPALSEDRTYWIVKDADGSHLRFYAVGMRDFNHKDPTRSDLSDSQKVTEVMFPGKDTDSWCSFNQLTFITTSTLAYTQQNTYQELMFFADQRGKVTKTVNGEKVTYDFRYGACTDSNYAYGMPVRPIKDSYSTTLPPAPPTRKKR